MDKERKNLLATLIMILFFLSLVFVYMIKDLKVKALKCMENPQQYLFDSYGYKNNVSCYCSSVINNKLSEIKFDLPNIVYSP